jgi:hypothetical protein
MVIDHVMKQENWENAAALQKPQITGYEAKKSGAPKQPRAAFAAANDRISKQSKPNSELD